MEKIKKSALLSKIHQKLGILSLKYIQNNVRRMVILQPMVSDPQNIGIYVTMDTIVDEMLSGKEKLIHRAIADFETCLSKLGTFVRDSTVCRRFMDVTFEHFPSYVEDLTIKMVDHVGNDDTSVMMYLVNRLIEFGDVRMASSIYNTLGSGQDLAIKEFVLGRFAYDIGDVDEARQHFLRAILTDTSFYGAYSYLDELDPMFGWLYFANISRVMKGEPPVIDDRFNGGEREELFCICDQWAKGDWNGAMAALRRLEAFDRQDPFTMALFAWMSAKLGSQRDSVEYYSKALNILKDSEFLSLELASAYSAIGDYDASTSLLRRMRTFNPHSPRILVAKFISLINEGRRQDASRTLDSLMSSPGLDAEVLNQCIIVLREHDMMMEATNLTKWVATRCIDRAYAEYLLSADSMANKDFRSAISHANAALREDKGYIRARCLRAKAYLETDGVVKAMQDVNRMLDESPDDMMVLDVKKDIHVAIGHYDDALALCNLMLSIDPRNANVMMDRADVLGLMGDHKNSLDSYREALNIKGDLKLFISILRELLKKRRVSDLCRLVDDFDDVFGRSTLVWRLRGNAEYVDGRYDDAIASYDRAAYLSPNEGEIWHSKGLAEEAAELYKDAEDSFGRALLCDLENTEYWISKAVIQEKRGNLRGAIVSLNKVITSAYNGVFPLTMKARLLSRCGRVREALYFLDQAQRIEPGNVDIMRMSKDAFMYLGEYDKAITLCRRLNILVKDDHGATADLISAYIRCDNRAAASELLVGLIRQPDLPFDILSKCALSSHIIGDFELEADALERALKLSPGDRSIMIRLAEAYTVSGYRDKAAELYLLLKESDPDDVAVTVKKAMLDVTPEESVPESVDEMIEDSESLMDLAQRTLESGMVDDAIRIYRKVMDDDPDCADAHVEVMDILLRRGDVVDVIAMASESSHLFPNDTRMMKILGDAYRSAGDDSKAIQAYTDAMRLGMDTAELHGSIASALESVGMVQMALDNYRLAVEKDPLNLEYKLSMAALELRMGHEESAEVLLNSVLVVDPRNVCALRAFVSLSARRNDSEAILALFDDLMDAAVDEDDIRFFESALRDVGENAKADRIAAKLSS